MDWQLAYLALEVIGFFSILLVGVRELCTQPRQGAAQLFGLLCFNSACARILARHEYAFWIPPELQIDVGILQAPMDILRNLTPGIFMILCHALFQDRPRFSRTLLALFAVQAALDGISAFAMSRPLDATLFNAVPALLQLLFVSVGICWIVGGWRSDLIESRRSLRWVFLFLFGSLVFVMVLLERLLLPWRDASIFRAHVVLSLLGACLSAGAVVVALLRSRMTFVDLFPVASKEQQRPIVAVAEQVRDHEAVALLQLLEEQHVYRETGLTMGSLAGKLGVPEYRLRRLIHESLGYRNFNAMLHDYRVREAVMLLTDPAKSGLPILTIALTVGYSSINPFNRAFRELKGMTPSAFRAKNHAPISSNLSPISKT